jgi:hypothetical protein
MHLVITIKSDPKGAYLVNSPAPAKGDWLESFNDGVAIKKKVPPLAVTTDDEHGSKFKDAIPNQASDFIISKKFADALAAAGVTNVQNFPVTVTDFAKKKQHEYLVCNVVGLVPCLDKARADIDWDTKDPKKIFMMNQLAVDEAAVDKFNKSRPARDQLKLFRLAEYPRFLLVSEDVAKSLQKAGVEGVEFRKPEMCGDFL